MAEGGAQPRERRRAQAAATNEDLDKRANIAIHLFLYLVCVGLAVFLALATIDTFAYKGDVLAQTRLNALLSITNVFSTGLLFSLECVLLILALLFKNPFSVRTWDIITYASLAIVGFALFLAYHISTNYQGFSDFDSIRKAFGNQSAPFICTDEAANLIKCENKSDFADAMRKRIYASLMLIVSGGFVLFLSMLKREVAVGFLRAKFDDSLGLWKDDAADKVEPEGAPENDDGGQGNVADEPAGEGRVT